MIVDIKAISSKEELYLKFGERPALTRATRPIKGVTYALTATQRAYLKGLYGVSPSKEVECLEPAGEPTWEVVANVCYDSEGNQYYVGWTTALKEPATLKCRWRSLGHSTPTGRRSLLTSFAVNPADFPDEPLKTESAAKGGQTGQGRKTKATKLSLDLSIFD